METVPQILANPMKPASNAAATSAVYKFDSNKNNINHLNNLFQVKQIQYHQYHQHSGRNNLRNVETRCSSNNNYRKPVPVSSLSSSPTPKSCYTNESAFTDSDYEAHLLDFLLLGDDFFLYMARMELRCKFRKSKRIIFFM